MSNFHGVYLLCSIENNKSVRGTYIGYTVLPGRRILQHNRFKKGGAHKTAKYAPWDMILCVHNFPNRTAGLRFEWAWQNPKISVRLKMYDWQKKKTENGVQYQIRVLERMLNTAPWNKLPLTVQWLRSEYKLPLVPPLHMPIALGPIEDQSEMEWPEKAEGTGTVCLVCGLTVTKDTSICCVQNQCTFHLICLAEKWVSSTDILPVSGICPQCHSPQLWGEMVRYKSKANKQTSADDQKIHWTDTLSQQL